MKVKLCLTLCDTVGRSPPNSSVHGILQARILEWVAISFSRGSSWPRDWTQVSHIAGRRFNLWATRETYIFQYITVLIFFFKLIIYSNKSVLILCNITYKSHKFKISLSYDIDVYYITPVVLTPHSSLVQNVKLSLLICLSCKWYHFGSHIIFFPYSSILFSFLQPVLFQMLFICIIDYLSYK